ncbi:SCP-like protein [Ancylostoma duodenale]|uniref:SCP-like protein n=1 Tax=Ancylostoma duodenale TaxID=51022 RepID=A0A0C2GNM6_9BILA|nr:SCP-like protein [Ancylostoma duodenale]
MHFLVVLAVFVTGSFATTDFQCWNFGQTNEIRHLYREQVNTLRSELAKGVAPNIGGKTCPTGSNIYRLDWDCILENHAQKAVNQCADHPQLTPKEEATLSMKNLTTCNPTPSFREQVKEWWDKVETVGLEGNAAFKPGLESFAVLANGLATRIGCAQKNCNGVLHMACMVYGKAANSTEQAIYEVGKSCEGDNQCTTYKESKCLKEKRLCAAGYPTSDAVVPPTVGTTTKTPTTTNPTTTKKPGPTPQKHCTGQEHMNTDLAREEFVNLHNQIRAAVAKGQVKMKGGELARKCARMKKFIMGNYNCNLEAEAYATASKCSSGDSEVQNENWFMSTTATNKKQAAKEAVTSWYKEIENGQMVQKTGSQNTLLPRLKINHFARMVWDTNTQIGCAVYKCSGNKHHAVCRYGPGVGQLGNMIYMMGPTCNQCQNTCIENAFCPQ